MGNSANINNSISEFHQLVRNFGTTAQRPTQDLITGQTYFDTTLGSWIYWTGSAWAPISGGSGGVTSATPPLAIAGTNIALNATAANDGGTIVKSPASQQTGDININGNMASGSVQTIASVVVGTQLYLGNVPILDRGATWPPTPVNGQRYYHTTFRSWFTYITGASDNVWRQEAPGVFNGIFPTVLTADNTVAPNIEVKRLDLSDTVWYWNGASWVPVAPSAIGVSVTNSAALTANSGSTVTLSFNTTNYDTNGFKTSTTDITIPAGLGGKYQINLQLGWTVASTAGQRTLHVLKNGTSILDSQVAGFSGFTHSQGVSTVRALVAGDVIKVTAFQNSGVNGQVYMDTSFAYLDLSRLGN